MKGTWILQGRVVSGCKTAARFTQLDWVQKQCREKLGFAPFPGTLNLSIEEDCFPIFTEMQTADTPELIPEGNNGCVGKAFPVCIEGLRGAIVIPDPRVNIHDKNVVEVIAPVRLRESLGLVEDQMITLIVDRPGDPPSE